MKIRQDGAGNAAGPVPFNRGVLKIDQMANPQPEPDEGLSQEERAYLQGQGEQPYRRRIERRRPAWLVAALVWASFGVYVPFWVGLHWAEMKRELQEERMYPVWHALAMLVPIYSFFRFHANFRVLNELLAQTRSGYRVRPLLAVATFVMVSLLVSVPVDDLVLTTLNLVVAVAAVSWVLYHGQTGMNAYWDTRPERTTTGAIKIWERLLIPFGAALWFLVILSLFVEGGQM